MAMFFNKLKKKNKFIFSSQKKKKKKKARELWKTTRSIDSTEISAVEEAFMASYNMIIA